MTKYDRNYCPTALGTDATIMRGTNFCPAGCFKQGAEVMREIGEGVSNLAHDFGQRLNNIETT